MRTTVAALTAVSLIALAGCSGSDDDSSEDAAEDSSSEATPEEETEEPEDTEEPEETEETDDSGDSGVTYDVPDGWEDATEAAQQSAPNVISAARDGEAGGGDFADNVNVIETADVGDVTLDDLEQQSAQELEGSGAQNVEQLPREEVDGEEALRQTATLQQGQVSYVVDQFITLQDGSAYVVTFSHGDDVSDADRQADIDLITESIDFG